VGGEDFENTKPRPLGIKPHHAKESPCVSAEVYTRRTQTQGESLLRRLRKDLFPVTTLLLIAKMKHSGSSGVFVRISLHVRRQWRAVCEAQRSPQPRRTFASGRSSDRRWQARSSGGVKNISSVKFEPRAPGPSDTRSLPKRSAELRHLRAGSKICSLGGTVCRTTDF
jgi:hypothetical protein